MSFVVISSQGMWYFHMFLDAWEFTKDDCFGNTPRIIYELPLKAA